jgi:hypothetical protein
MGQVAMIERKWNFGTDEITGLPEVYVFDATIREAHHFEISITDNPVETGVSLADHAYSKPDTLDMEVAVSDAPLIRDDAGTPSYRLATTWTEAGEGNVRRSVNAWKFLTDKAKEFAVFDLVTGLKAYVNMMIESGDAEQTKDSAGIMRARLKLRQVQFATTASVLYPPRGPKKTTRAAAPKTDKGKVPAEEVPEPPVTPDDSLLYKALTALFAD